MFLPGFKPKFIPSSLSNRLNVLTSHFGFFMSQGPFPSIFFSDVPPKTKRMKNCREQGIKIWALNRAANQSIRKPLRKDGLKLDL